MSRRCPRCRRDENLYISRPRTKKEKYLWLMIMMRPVRCGDCGHRYHRCIFANAKPRTVSKPVPEPKPTT